jgi:bifunctional DNA-binding transcriptional regulator/antitoxin component of YhaV-PrlF toxin-antitoxin module
MADTKNIKREIFAKVSESGRVTIPAEVRKLIGARYPARVIFIIDEGRVSLSVAPLTVEDVAGSVKSIGRTDWDNMIREAKDEKVRRDYEKLRSYEFEA